jgi:hypothetical protein
VSKGQEHIIFREEETQNLTGGVWLQWWYCEALSLNLSTKREICQTCEQIHWQSETKAIGHFIAKYC